MGTHWIPWAWWKQSPVKVKILWYAALWPQVFPWNNVALRKIEPTTHKNELDKLSLCFTIYKFASKSVLSSFSEARNRWLRAKEYSLLFPHLWSDVGEKAYKAKLKHHLTIISISFIIRKNFFVFIPWTQCPGDATPGQGTVGAVNYSPEFSVSWRTHCNFIFVKFIMVKKFIIDKNQRQLIRIRFPSIYVAKDVYLI